MKSKLLQVTKLLHLLYEWLCCSLCFAFFEVVLLKQDVHYFLLPITGAMFVYSYILREKAQHYLWLFVGHVALRLPMLLLPVSMEYSVVLFPDSLLSVLGICKKHMEK